MNLGHRLLGFHGCVRVPHDSDAVLQLLADMVRESSGKVDLPKRQGAVHSRRVFPEIFQAFQETASPIQKVFGRAGGAA